MNKKPYTSYNPYFLIPFLVWVIAGGVALLFFDKQLLFAIVNTHHTAVTDTIMRYISWMGEGYLSAIILLMLLGVSSLRNWWYFCAAIFSNAFSNFTTQAVKSWLNAPRPLNYFKEAPWIHTSPEWPRLMERSFPSGHTSAAFTLFCLLALLLPKPYRHWGVVFFILALLVGYSRIYLAAHFFLDVYVGSIIGTIFTVIVVAIMNNRAQFFFKRDVLTETES